MTFTETVDDYLARLDAALRERHEREREEIVAEVRDHLTEAARSGDDPEAATRKAVESLGPPDVLATRLSSGDGAAPAAERVPRILGMPYNFGPLSAEQVTSRLWNPSDPRILMPRVFGIGWTVNFGAVAVKLHLLRPDDVEERPFSGVSDRALLLGALLPVAVDIAGAVLAFAYRRLATPLPVHWGVSEPNGFAAPLTAAAELVGPAVVAGLVVGAFWLAGHLSRAGRVLSVAGLSFASVLLVGLYFDSLAWGLTGRGLYNPGIPVLAGFVVFFAMLFVYARLSLRAEWRRQRAVR